METLGPMVSNNTPVQKPHQADNYPFLFCDVSGQLSCLATSLEGSKPRLCTTTLLLCPPLQERKQLILDLAVNKLPEAVLVVVWFLCICSVASLDHIHTSCFTT